MGGLLCPLGKRNFSPTVFGVGQQNAGRQLPSQATWWAASRSAEPGLTSWTGRRAAIESHRRTDHLPKSVNVTCVYATCGRNVKPGVARETRSGAEIKPAFLFHSGCFGGALARGLL